MRPYFGAAVLLLSVFVALSAFLAFFIFLCFFEAFFVSDLVSVLAEVPVSVVLPCANAPNETKQKAARAAAIVRIMLISLGNSEWTRPSGLALGRASSVPSGSGRISPAAIREAPERRPGASKLHADRRRSGFYFAGAAAGASVFSAFFSAFFSVFFAFLSAFFSVALASAAGFSSARALKETRAKAARAAAIVRIMSSS